MAYFTNLKKIGLPFFILTVIGTSLDQWITWKMESLIASPQGLSAWVWAYGAASMLLSLTYPLLGTLLVLSSVKKESLPVFIRRHFKQNLIEEMRAWGQCMLWFVLLILPGLVQFLRLLFVPLVVTLDSAYERGEKDALAESRRLSQGRLLPLLGLFCAFFLIAPGMLTLFDEWRLIWKTPVSALLICFVEMLLNLWFIHLLLHLYRKGAGYESLVSVEGH